MAIPGQHLHPHATGAAAKTAESLQPQDLVFYSGWFCPKFVQRTWIALKEKRIPYEYKETNPYKKAPEHLLMYVFLATNIRANPSIAGINLKRFAPSGVYKNGPAFYKSDVLNELLEETYPSHPLVPSYPTRRALARIWIDYIGKSTLAPNMRLQRSQTEEGRDEARKHLIAGLKKFEAQIKGPYFLGGQFSLVDVTIVPWIIRDRVIVGDRAFKREDVGTKWVEYAKSWWRVGIAW